MELRQLKYFVKVAELLNFSEAAKALYITQSTLSQQIKQLENEFDVQLFQRNSHDVFLTESGEELLPYALATLHSADTCMDKIRDLHKLLSGTLRIGATYTFSPILSEALLTFMKRYPNVKLKIFYKTSEELIEMLEQHDLDFVLSFKSTNGYDHIESHILFDNRLSVVVNENHPLAKKQRINLSELEGYDLALPAFGLQARNAFDKMIEGKDYNLNIRVELNEVNILMKVVKDSNLVTILSEATLHGENGIKAIPIDFPDNQMEGCVHVLKNSYRKASSKEFVRMLSESNAVRERVHDWLDNVQITN